MTKEERDRFLLNVLFPGRSIWGNLSETHFGLLWDQAKTEDWWPDFWDWVFEREADEYGTKTIGRLMSHAHFWQKVFIGEFGEDKSLIHPDRFADTLAEFLTQRKEKA